jgi:threonine dehydratase
VERNFVVKKASYSGICEARAKLEGVVPMTPLLPLRLGMFTLWCKCESDQPMGAFKLRGAWHRLTALSDQERRGGVVAFSSGNHAQGVAWAAQRLGLRATIVMPSNAPDIKVAGTRAMGAEVVFYDRMSEDRDAIAAGIAAARGAVLVPPFDDPYVIEGQGSSGIEALEQFATLGLAVPDLVVAPCGGGGLASGLSLAIPSARMAIVEPEGWDDVGMSLAKGELVSVPSEAPPTICDSLQTLRASSRTFEILLERKPQAVSVNEAEVFAAMRLAHVELGKRPRSWRAKSNRASRPWCCFQGAMLTQRCSNAPCRARRAKWPISSSRSLFWALSPFSGAG